MSKIFGGRRIGSSCPSGLPDGLFLNQKSIFGKILEGLAMKDAGIFYGHLVYFATILYILWPFVVFCNYLVSFSHFGMLYQDKSGNPAVRMFVSRERPMSWHDFR
jgi:hypothetical protein